MQVYDTSIDGATIKTHLKETKMDDEKMYVGLCERESAFSAERQSSGHT